MLIVITKKNCIQCETLKKRLQNEGTTYNTLEVVEQVTDSNTQITVDQIKAFYPFKSLPIVISTTPLSDFG